MPRTDLLRPVHELLRAGAPRFGTRVAFADLDERTASVAGDLTGVGVWPSDRLVVLLDGVPAVESILAIVRAGAIAVPLDPALDAEELARLVEDSGADTVITDAARLPLVTALDPVPLNVIEAASLEKLATTEPAEPAGDELGLDDLAFLTYTAGTTGPRKGVLSTQRNVLWAAAAAYAPLLGLSEEDCLQWSRPVHEGMSWLVAAIAVGASVRLTADEAATVAADARVVVG